MNRLKQLWERIEKVNGRLIYALAMLGSAASLTALPNNLATAGVIGFVEDVWGIDRLPLAAVFALSAAWVFVRRPIGLAYIISTAPMLFYIFATFLYALQTPLNMTVVFFYGALYLRILMDVSKP